MSQMSMDPEAELRGLRDKVVELEQRLSDGIAKIIAEPNNARRVFFERFFVGLLTEYEETVRVWARHELLSDPEWADPRISRSLLEKVRDEGKS
jgi:hypothetical protein